MSQLATKFSKKCFCNKTKKSVTIKESNKAFIINLKEKTCNCKYFLKFGVCSHLIAYYNIVDSSFFGEDYFNDDGKFIFKKKRGRHALASKALEKKIIF